MSARAAISDDDQIVFLLSCVRNANGGVVNYNNVVKECQIVSTGAAAKRFSRLNKKYPMSGNGAATENNEDGSAEEPAQPKPKPAPKTAASKRGNAGGGKAASKAEKTSKKSAPATAPLAGGIAKKRSSPTKNSQFTTAFREPAIIKEGGQLTEEQFHQQEMPTFFSAEIAPYLGEAEHDDTM